jgi:putative DNA primase/helicase
MVKRSEAIPNDIAELRGARFIPMCEGEEGQTLAAGLVKSWTGGDIQKARFLHKEWFSMDPVGKLVFATNYRPSIKDVGEAMWDRVHLVPFKVRIPDDEQDLHFGDKLFDQEAAGILNWLLGRLSRMAAAWVAAAGGSRERHGGVPRRATPAQCVHLRVP